MSFIGISQEIEEPHYYWGPRMTLATNILSSLDYQDPFSCLATVGTTYLRGEIPFSEYHYLLIEGTLGLGVINGDFYPSFLLGSGVKLKLSKNWYTSIICYPRIHIVGVGHQIYGDYMTLWLTFTTGVGYRCQLSPNSFLFIEANMPIDITLLSEAEHYMNNCGLGITFGYSYLIR